MLNKKTINKLLKKFKLEMHGVGYMQSLRKYAEPPNPFQVQSEIVKLVKTVFDIGANHGDTVEKYVNLYPDASIFAFEPSPSVFSRLNKRFKKINNVTCVQIAIADKDDSFTFYTNHNPDTNSLLKSQKTGLNSDTQVANVGNIMVQATSIDLFCQKYEIKQIDILKIDIQGGELMALKGASEMLKNKAIKLIYTESYFKKQYVNQPLFHDISLYLEQFDYFLQDIYNPIYGDGSIVWCDAIFRP